MLIRADPGENGPHYGYGTMPICCRHWESHLTAELHPEAWNHKNRCADKGLDPLWLHELLSCNQIRHRNRPSPAHRFGAAKALHVGFLSLEESNDEFETF